MERRAFISGLIAVLLLPTKLMAARRRIYLEATISPASEGVLLTFTCDGRTLLGTTDSLGRANVIFSVKPRSNQTATVLGMVEGSQVRDSTNCNC